MMNKFINAKNTIILIIGLLIVLSCIFIYKKMNTISTYDGCVKTSFLEGKNRNIQDIEYSCRIIFPTLNKLSKKEDTNLACIDSSDDKIIYKIRVTSNKVTLNNQQEFPIEIWTSEMINFKTDTEENDTKRKVMMFGNILNNGNGEIIVQYKEKLNDVQQYKNDDIHYIFKCVEN